MAKRAHRKKQGPEGARSATEKPSARPTLPDWPTILQVVIILAVGWWVYAPVLHGAWLMDDDFDIGSNPITRSATGLWKIWLEPGSQIDYYPIKASVQWLQWHLWGEDTFGYHATNIGLHLVSALLVWRLFAKLNLKFAWLGGLIFALHPVMVESVAWIAELKNTLSLPPLLLAMIAVIDYEKRGRRSDYWWAAGFFLISMLCKIGAVTFPFAFLLYFWWKRGRIGWNDLKASVPFFLTSVILGFTTLVTERSYHPYALPLMQTPESPASRVILSGLTLTFYFFQCLWPVNLLPLYPRWSIHPKSLLQLLPWPVILALLYALWRRRTTWSHAALLGLGFFIILIAPFLGFLTGSYMRLSWVMDHLLYIPIIGLIGLAVAGWEQLGNRLGPAFRFGGIGVWVALLAVMAFGSHAYTGIFINPATLWRYTIAHNPDASLPHNNLGTALIQEGRLNDAIPEFQKATRLKPDYFEAHNNLGSALAQTGHVPEGITEVRESLRLNPDYPEGHLNLGNILLRQNQTAEAQAEFEACLRINPHDAEAHYCLGNLFHQTNRVAEAIEQYTTAVQINPDHAPARNNLGGIYLQLGQIPEAVEQIQESVRINPQSVLARTNLGIALAQEGKVAEAIEQFQAVLQLDPNSTFARDTLAHLQAFQQGTPPQP